MSMVLPELFFKVMDSESVGVATTEEMKTLDGSAVENDRFIELHPYLT